MIVSINKTDVKAFVVKYPARSKIVYIYVLEQVPYKIKTPTFLMTAMTCEGQL